MNQITNVPKSVSKAGYEFNYALWTAGTTITLVNTPWDALYRDVVQYGPGELDTWIDAQEDRIHVTDVKLHKLDRPVILDIPFERAAAFNYLRAHNPKQPIDGSLPSTFYYFVTKVEYGAPNATILHLQLDVWQTFQNVVKFGRAFVEQGHIGIANENQTADNGRKFLTVPEGFDLGNEYVIDRVEKKLLGSVRGADEESASTCYVLMASTISLDTDGSLEDSFGTEEKPKFRTAKGSSFENLPNGAELYLFQGIAAFKEAMSALSDVSWVAQGITSITLFPQMNELISAYGQGTEVFWTSEGKVFRAKRLNAGSRGGAKITIHGIIDSPPTLTNVRYMNLKKFNTYPYAVYELTANTGAPLIIKPESWVETNKTVSYMVYTHAAPPNPRISIVPYHHNAKDSSASRDIVDSVGLLYDGADFFDHATGIYNLPTFTVVNNSGSLAVAQQANSIAFQYNNASWEQERALRGAQTAFAQNQGSIEMNDALLRNTQRTTNETVAQNNFTQAGRSITSGAQSIVGAIGQGPGGLLSAASGVGGAAADYAISTNQNTQMGVINNNSALAQTTAQNRQANLVGDTNLKYAQFAAQGDYAQAQAGIQAKVQDLRLTSPATMGQMGGEAFNFAVNDVSVYVKVKRIQPSVMAMIGEYWLQFGYKVHRNIMMPADLLVCSNFTYWKLQNTYLTSGRCPEPFKQAIRGIFEKGVTVWGKPEDIGMIDPAINVPKVGITL